MAPRKSVKEMMRDGDRMKVTRIRMDTTEGGIAELLSAEPCDLIYIDSQHGPHTEWDILRICSAAEALGTPVQLRIKHTRHPFLIGGYLDLGLLGVKVPEVEEEAVVQEALDAFYFPPVGKRSWGGPVGYGRAGHGGRREYAAWWNENGVLGIKIESVKAVLNVRSLAKPGVDYLDFGGEALSFDLETSPHPHLTTLDECRAFVRRELVDNPIRVF